MAHEDAKNPMKGHEKDAEKLSGAKTEDMKKAEEANKPAEVVEKPEDMPKAEPMPMPPYQPVEDDKENAPVEGVNPTPTETHPGEDLKYIAYAKEEVHPAVELGQIRPA